MADALDDEVAAPAVPVEDAIMADALLAFPSDDALMGLMEAWQPTEVIIPVDAPAAVVDTIIDDAAPEPVEVDSVPAEAPADNMAAAEVPAVDDAAKPEEEVSHPVDDAPSEQLSSSSAVLECAVREEVPVGDEPPGEVEDEPPGPEPEVVDEPPKTEAKVVEEELAAGPAGAEAREAVVEPPGPGEAKNGEAPPKEEERTSQEATSSSRWWKDSTFDFESKEEEEEAAYETTGSEWIGRTVRRTFGRKVVSYGIVESWLPPEKNEGRAFWRVRHDDGDEEDLEQDEVEAAAFSAETIPRPSAGGEVREEKAEEKELADEGPPELESLAAPELVAAFRAMEAAARSLEDEASVRSFGGEALQWLGDIGHSAPEPVRGLALYRVEQLAQRWKASASVEDEFDPGAYCDVLCGLYGLERAGVGHPELKHEWREFYKRLAHKRGEEKACAALLGYDPRSDEGLAGPLTLEKRGIQKTRFRAMTWALLTTYAADRLGIHVGAKTVDVLRRLQPTRERYASAPKSLSRDPWIDQMDLVFAIVMVCSNFGELRVLPSLLSKEYAVLVDPAALDAAKSDVHLLAGVCRCARVFGPNDDLAGPVVETASKLLVAAQRQDGTFPTRDKDDHPYTRVHAALAAASALYAPVFRGFGPSSARLKDLLASKTFAGTDDAQAYAACGPKLLDPSSMRALAARCYDGAASTDDDDAVRTLEALAMRRLRGILKWKTAVDAKTIDDYECRSGYTPPHRRSKRRRLR